MKSTRHNKLPLGVRRMLRRESAPKRRWELYFVRTGESLSRRFKYGVREITNEFSKYKSAEAWAKALDPTGNDVRIREKKET